MHSIVAGDDVDDTEGRRLLWVGCNSDGAVVAPENAFTGKLIIQNSKFRIGSATEREFELEGERER